ncbi:3-phytase [Gillisia mitskevichiae]|uniref:3-phytase n=1 Tax=Gillisia mitskevichiae TaxID=270921 RepID=A0A495PUN6_9FLAO|nr:phytase [Gillisia mitskevichiae]RKS53937.1 3-phytase [Gillisia mitskevichiae]
MIGNKFISFFLLMSSFFFCTGQKIERKIVQPDIITQQIPNDSEDPAIWVNYKYPAESIIFGTDKNIKGAVYAFNLNGNIIPEKTIYNLNEPNNIDIAYNVIISEEFKADILVVTERGRKQIRIFAIPSMQPLDNGGLAVFVGEPDKYNEPMGVAFYNSPVDKSTYIIVSRKNGPVSDYLYQYKLMPDDGALDLKLVRKFGTFSNEQEIEAIAVDSDLGFIYYADESKCIRKYYAEPLKGNMELGCFGEGLFEGDIEGIAIANFKNGAGYIIVSNQKKGTFNIFSRKSNEFIGEINLNTKQTDGCEVVTIPLNNTFKKGLFAAMNNDRNYYFYDLEKLGLFELN